MLMALRATAELLNYGKLADEVYFWLLSMVAKICLRIGVSFMVAPLKESP